MKEVKERKKRKNKTMWYKNKEKLETVDNSAVKKKNEKRNEKETKRNASDKKNNKKGIEKKEEANRMKERKKGR